MRALSLLPDRQSPDWLPLQPKPLSPRGQRRFTYAQPVLTDEPLLGARTVGDRVFTHPSFIHRFGGELVAGI